MRDAKDFSSHRGRDHYGPPRHTTPDTMNNTDTLLHELPDSAFVFGGQIDDMLRAAGYSEGAVAVIGQLHAWNWSIAELKAYLA